MSVGCQHNPDNACQDCLKSLSGGQAAFFATVLRPEMGESLSQFQARVQADETLRATDPAAADAKPTYVEPSIAEQKQIIRDTSVPEPVRRFWREKLYGKGGSGRKGVQQERAAKMVESLNANFQDRTIETLAASYGNAPTKSAVGHLSGKHRKRARRLLRQLAKAVKSAG